MAGVGGDTPVARRTSSSSFQAILQACKIAAGGDSRRPVRWRWAKGLARALELAYMDPPTEAEHLYYILLVCLIILLPKRSVAPVWGSGAPPEANAERPYDNRLGEEARARALDTML